jgi:acyl-CoA thioesterase-1
MEPASRRDDGAAARFAAAWAGVCQGPAGTVLVLGDSLSAAHNIPADAGWVSLLQQRVRQQSKTPARIVNASMSGETTAGALTPAGPAGEGKADRGGDRPGRQRRTARADPGAGAGQPGKDGAGQPEGRAKVLLLGIDVPPNYGPPIASAWRRPTRRWPRSTGAAAALPAGGRGLQPGMMQADGLHPTAQAQPKVLDNVWPLLGRCSEPFVYLLTELHRVHRRSGMFQS